MGVPEKPSPTSLPDTRPDEESRADAEGSDRRRPVRQTVLVSEREVDEESLSRQIGAVPGHDVEEVVKPPGACDVVLRLLAHLEGIEEPVLVDRRRQEEAGNASGDLDRVVERPAEASRGHGLQGVGVREGHAEIGPLVEDPLAGRMGPHPVDVGEDLRAGRQELDARDLLHSPFRNRVREPTGPRQQRAVDVSFVQSALGHRGPRSFEVDVRRVGAFDCGGGLLGVVRTSAVTRRSAASD